MPLLPQLTVTRKIGSESFRDGLRPLPFDLLNFWQWSASDLASNALRGRLAEFLVAQALGVADGVRSEWDPYDLQLPNGVTIEVKSAAYLQTWAQTTTSSIGFDIAPTRSWDAHQGMMAQEARRQADIYVFALLDHQDKGTLNPMDVGQWIFFVLPTAVLDARLPAQKHIGLAGLRRLKPVERAFCQLREAVDLVAHIPSNHSQISGP